MAPAVGYASKTMLSSSKVVLGWDILQYSPIETIGILSSLKRHPDDRIH